MTPQPIHYTPPGQTADDWLDDEKRCQALRYLMAHDPLYNNLQHHLAGVQSEQVKAEMIILAMARDREELVNIEMTKIDKMAKPATVPEPAPPDDRRIIMPEEAQ